MNIRDARIKIKNHLITQGHRKDFVITAHMCSFWWRVLNQAVFKGILPHPTKFDVYENSSHYACCRHDESNFNVSIEITPSLNETRAIFISTLVHEMVHQWQMMYRHDTHPNNRMTHGSTFYDWAVEVETHTGLRLHIDDQVTLFTERFQEKIDNE